MDACSSVMMLVLAVFLLAVPSVWGRKCYQCDSYQQPGCADANQISQLYTDCSNGGYSGSYSSSQYGGGGIQQPIGGIGGIGGQPFGNQPYPQGQIGNPSLTGSYGSSGYGAGGDRCIKITTVGGFQQGGSIQGGQPQIRRMCGSANGVQGDGCYWQGNVQICTCNSNYCNGSSRLSTGSLSAIVFAGVATLLSHLYRSSL